MATQLDYYGILKVNPAAEKEVIHAAYRRLAVKFHPDVSQLSDATERMKQINAAYEVLSDPVKRAAYDAARGMAPPPGTSPCTAARSRYFTSAWRTLLIVTGLLLLAVAVLRLGLSFLFIVPKLMVPLVVFSLVVWLLFTLTKQRG